LHVRVKWGTVSCCSGTLAVNRTHFVFGPYSFAAYAGDLRKNGIAVKLQRKPKLALRALLEAQGEIVTRRELQERLWPKDTFVDFEQGLNVAIKRLRDALCDSAGEPRYIETVPSAGYRFIAEVQTIHDGNGRSAPSALKEPQLDASSPAALATAVGAGSQIDTAAVVATPAAPSAASTEPEGVAAPWRAFRAWLLIRRAMAAVAFAGVVLALSAASYVGWKKLRPQTDARLQTHRIVVLPFKNLTGESAQKYFCDGLTDELIAQLGTLDPQRLQVIARTSAMHYEGSSLTAAQIGAELKSDYVLEGSVRNLETLYRITIQLIDAQSQTNLWVGIFDREFRDVLDLHRDVALAISQEIGDRISAPFQHPAFGAQPINPLAHDAYLRGRFHWNKRTVTDLRDSVGEFEKAIAIDADYPEAHAGLADAYSMLASYGAIPFREGYPRARIEAQKALQLNPHSAEARASLAFVEAYYGWKFEQAERDFAAAIRENPNYAIAHHWYGLFLSQRGRHEEALRELNLAAQLDPFSLTTGIDLGNAYILAGRYGEAERQLLQVRALDPDYYGTYGAMCWLYALQGRLPEAERENEALKKLSGNHFGDDHILAYAYAKAGQTGRTRDLLSQISKTARERGGEPPCPIDAYLVLGDDAAALRCLDDGIRQRADWLVPLQQDAEISRMASDPRFQARLKQVGLPHSDVNHHDR
jgi:TolB-like protein/DNA-binding winged helix-turn-helix (wHTH) protein/Tfp pilus assembly protein PilF